MSSIKDIRQRMNNVRTTKQVLNAMDMVSATKLHKARLRLDGIRPMYREMRAVIGGLKCYEEVQAHSFAAERDVKNTAYVVITGDKGLCGSYHFDICEAARKHMQGRQEKILVIGAKGAQYFKRRDKEILRRITDASEAQIYEGAERLAKFATALYASGKADEVFVAYTYFESTLSHVPRVEQLLPLCGAANEIRQAAVETNYEPDVVSLLEHMMPLYLHMCFFAALSESMACEHAARMLNMESAGKNAGEIMDDLKLMYNRKRQSGITQELNEIVSSANIL